MSTCFCKAEYVCERCKLQEAWNQECANMRTFDSGATRDTDTSKIDPEAYFSPQVLRAYCEYMRSHQVQSDGQVRSGDNWQKGIPREAYMKSMWRHFMDVWEAHRLDLPMKEELLCALLFNAMGYLHEVLLGRSSQ
jgi:hypothetical protein